MKQNTRISYKQAAQAVQEYNRHNNLVYRDKGYLSLENDGNRNFLNQIARQGETCVRSIPTLGTPRDCIRSIPPDLKPDPVMDLLRQIARQPVSHDQGPLACKCLPCLWRDEARRLINEKITL